MWFFDLFSSTPSGGRFFILFYAHEVLLSRFSCGDFVLRNNIHDLMSILCGEPAISLHSHHVSLVQWTTRLLPVTRDPGSKPQGGYLCETVSLLLALSRYIGDPNVIDHFCCFVWGGLRPEPSLGPRADNVIIPLDLTQLFCPGFTLAAGPPSGLTTDGVGCWGEPCGEPAITLHSHHVSLVQWTTRLLPITRDPGSEPQGGTYVWNRDSPVSVVSLHMEINHPWDNAYSRLLEDTLDYWRQQYACICRWKWSPFPPQTLTRRRIHRSV